MRSWARSTASAGRVTAAGSSTRSTAPRATCAASRCGRRSSLSRSTARWWPAWRRRRRSVAGGGRRGAVARSPTARRSGCPRWVRCPTRTFARRTSASSRSVGSATRTEPSRRSAGGRSGFADFWGHMLVAEGAVDVMIEPILALWDVAALRPIVEEAGGRLQRSLGGRLGGRCPVRHDERAAARRRARGALVVEPADRGADATWRSRT